MTQSMIEKEALYWCAGAQPRFQSCGDPIPWSRLLYRTKYGWYTQFRVITAVCYVTVITLFIKKLGWSVQILGVRTPSGCALAGVMYYSPVCQSSGVRCVMPSSRSLRLLQMTSSQTQQQCSSARRRSDNRADSPP